MRLRQGLGMKLASKTIWAGGILACGVAGAQTNVDNFERQLEQIQRDTMLRIDERIPADQRALFDYGMFLSAGYLSADDDQDDNHVLWQFEAIAYGRLNIDNVQEVFLRGRATYRDFNSGDSFDGDGDAWLGPEFERAYYRFDSRQYEAAYKGEIAQYGFTFTGGRDLAYWGNGLTLSRDIDGIFVDLYTAPVDVQILAGVTPNDTVDFDSSRPHYEDDTNRGFYGGLLSKQIGSHVPFIYGLLQQDYNPNEVLQEGGVDTEFNYNSYYIGAGSAGSIGDRLLYGVEFTYEGGRSLSNSFEINGPNLEQVEQTEDDINAYAFDARLDYLLADERRSRINGEVIIASGDDDRGNTSTTFNGNQPNTKDEAFNGFGLLNTGLAFAPTVSNMLTFRVGASTFPWPDHPAFNRLQIGTDFFIYNKLQADAPIDEPTFDEQFLGVEPDFFLNWQVTSDVSFAARYGIFFPSSDAFADDEIRQFLYVNILYGF
jgi:hypothetical protein